MFFFSKRGGHGAGVRGKPIPINQKSCDKWDIEITLQGILRLSMLYLYLYFCYTCICVYCVA